MSHNRDATKHYFRNDRFAAGTLTGFLFCGKPVILMGMADSVPKARSFHLTPDRLILALVAVEGILSLSEWFHWFPKGWPVLIAVAAVGVAMLLMVLCFVMALLHRWRFQFSIRSLLVLTVAVAIPCGWLAVEMEKAKEQAEVVNVLEGLGGRVRHDNSYDASGKYIPNAQLPGPEFLRQRLGADFFTSVVYVWSYDDRFTNVGLIAVKKLPQLRMLALAATPVTDAGLRNLSGLRQLRKLAIQEMPITDKGLKNLAGLNNLEWLKLLDTRITDVGLKHLMGLSKLKELDLKETNVTDEGVKKLQQALPNCKITH